MSIDPALLEEFRRQRGSNTLRPDFREALNPEESRFRTWESMSPINNNSSRFAGEVKDRREYARRRADQVAPF